MNTIKCYNCFERIDVMKKLIKQKKKIYLVGEAGTGKKFILNYLKFYMKDQKYEPSHIIISNKHNDLAVHKNGVVVEFIGKYNPTTNDYTG